MRILLGFMGLAIFFVSSESSAYLLEAGGNFSEAYKSGFIGLSKMYEYEDEELHISNWSVSGTLSRSKFTNDSGNDSFSNTRELGLGGGIVFSSSWNLDLLVNRSNTPETEFKSIGGVLSLSYSRFETKWPFSLGISYGHSSIEQHIEFLILSVLVVRDFSLDQKTYELFGSLSPANWLSLKLTSQFHDYSYSKTDFQKAFPSNFLNYYAPNLISSIGGLPEYSYQGEVSFYFLDTWSVTAAVQKNHLIVDDSEMYFRDLSVSQDFKKWNLTLGVSQVETSQSTDMSGLINFGFLL